MGASGPDPDAPIAAYSLSPVTGRARGVQVRRSTSAPGVERMRPIRAASAW